MARARTTLARELPGERSRLMLDIAGFRAERKEELQDITREAIARVRIVPGTGEWKINGRSLEEYFPNKVHQQLVNEPLKVLELDGSYDVLVRVHGGGPSGQAGAVRLGVARSLNGVDPELNRPALKQAGFLTRDARVPERKKAGLKKARKAPQYSKR